MAKPNKNEIEKLIRKDWESKFNLLQDGDGRVKITRPNLVSRNRSLFKHELLTNDGERITTYYIEEKTIQRLIELFDEYNIPKSNRDDLSYCFICMMIGKYDSSSADRRSLNQRKANNEFRNYFDLMKEIQNDSTIITGIKLQTSKRKKDGSFGAINENNFSHHVSSNFLMEIIKYCFTDKNKIKLYEDIYDSKVYNEKEISKNTNTLNNIIQEYTERIYMYLVPIVELHERKKLKRPIKLSDNKSKTFIGRFIELAGLFDEDKDYSNKEITTKIKQKLINLKKMIKASKESG